MNRPTKPPTDLYEQDFFLWTQDQARALRAAAGIGANLPLDWENLAEEIESLGRSDRRELASRIRQILIHLLKLETTTATEPRAGWRNTIATQRADIEDLLETSPSLRHELPALVGQQHRKALVLAKAELAAHGDALPQNREREGAVPFTPDQVLGDWWPPEPRR